VSAPTKIAAVEEFTNICFSELVRKFRFHPRENFLSKSKNFPKADVGESLTSGNLRQKRALAPNHHIGRRFNPKLNLSVFVADYSYFDIAIDDDGFILLA
jgi:hypothetical protein